MNLMKTDPWRSLRQIQTDLQNLFSHRWQEPWDTGGLDVMSSQWAPLADIKEDKEGYRILIDLPGLDAKDIEVTVDNNALTIRGERRLESDTEKSGYHRVERMRGSFLRRFSLPDISGDSRVSATFQKGVLDVYVPKQPQAGAKKIDIVTKP